VQQPPAPDPPPAPGALPGWLAVVLVAGTSAAVLVVEILAGRLLAPYVGVSLETYTAIIGTVLTGIALGAAAGGWAADRTDPRRLLPALLVVGGGLAIASIPIVRSVARDIGRTEAAAGALAVSALAFIPAAAVLSAVPPVVVKLQLRDLSRTGTTVGRLSAWSTAGAITGTFVTGFVLVAVAAVTTLIVVVGLLLAAAGAVLWVALRPRTRGGLAPPLALVALALAGAAVTDSPCDVETRYYCASIVPADDRASGRVLVLDDLRHSYVDLDDPSHLGFWYTRRAADAIDAFAPSGALDVVSIGGGALTLPTWIRATRPGSVQVVLEIDPDLVELVADELGRAAAPGLDVVTGDGRSALRDLPDDSADVIVGDAFGGRAVPWHLTTVEFVRDLARVLRPGGIYVVNVIDGPGQRFLRAAIATIAQVLPHVAVMRSGSLVDGGGGNAVIAAGQEPLDASAWDERRVRTRDHGAVLPDVASFARGATVLTDDRAPVDQLLLDGR